MNNGEEIVRYNPARTLTPVMNLQVAQARLKEFQEFVKEYMVEGEDYGLIPGTQKKTLYKPGSDKLCELYGLSDSYRIIDRLVDFDRGLFDYEIECTLSRDGFPVATGLGSCSSYEGKYRWRDAKRICPQCQQETIIKGKKEYGGGWLCFKNKGGCGAKFDENDPAIVDQEIGRIENDDIATLKNTIIKMAKKRAKVDATLSATRSAGVFTQDLNDPEGEKKKPPVQQPQRKSAPKQTGQEQKPGCINNEQISKIWAKGLAEREDGPALTREQVIQIVKNCGYETFHDIPQTQLDRVLDAIDRGGVTK